MRYWKVVCMSEQGTPKYLRHYTLTNGKREWKGASSESYCNRLAYRMNRMIKANK